MVPKAGIEQCEGNMITFSDGSKQEFDVIILCTGYSPEFSFLPDGFARKSFMQRYKFVFDNEDPSLGIKLTYKNGDWCENSNDNRKITLTL